MAMIVANYLSQWGYMYRIVRVTLLVFLIACKDLTKAELPAGVPNQETLDNLEGALGLYRATLCQMFQCAPYGESAIIHTILTIGLMTDEFRLGQLGFGQPTAGMIDVLLDSRRMTNLPIDGNDKRPYEELHAVRVYSQLAAAALAAHGDTLSTALRGHVFALEAFAIVYLADIYCSGVPLSTIDHKRDYTYHAGSSTRELYLKAISLFDTAIALSGDSVRILNFARVGKARALNNIGLHADAAAVAREVPDAFIYAQQISMRNSTSIGGVFETSKITVSEVEGSVGMPYIRSKDPRTRVVPYRNGTTTSDTLWYPAKFGTPIAVLSVSLASGVEARLIEAEQFLHEGKIAQWLNVLNSLRTNGTNVLVPSSVNPDLLETRWNPGIGRVALLEPLSDPGENVVETAKTKARIDLMFRERAAWLFALGHRQGDLRRLVREQSLGGYGRIEDTVYPTGPYQGSALFTEYGHDVDMTIPQTEFRNPFFKGCIERGA